MLKHKNKIQYVISLKSYRKNKIFKGIGSDIESFNISHSKKENNKWHEYIVDLKILKNNKK